VDSFDMEFLPTDLRGWVSDISDRLQCPPDYVAISAIVSLGSLLGRRLGIKPQTKTDWIELANLWGMFIGRPGMLKSPAMDEALKFIRHLEAEALKEYDVAREAYEAGIEAFNLRRSVKKTLEKDALKKLGGNATGDLTSMELGDEPLEPTPVRFRTNDSTYQAIGELLVANPNGLLVERDELVSLLKHLDREEEVVARGFYLTGWGGQSPYTFDRIGRGHQHIDAVCLSVLGNTQPSRIAEYVWRANADGAGGDGLLQRFGLAAWPEPAGEWKNVDRFPDNRARETAWSVFERVAAIDHNRALKLGAELGRFDYGAAFVALAVCPDRVPEERWRDCVGDAEIFLREFGERAHELGWTARDLFGLSAVPANPAPLYNRMSRYDETGLLWLLERRKTVVDLTEDTAAVRHPSGSITTYRRHRKPGLGPLGDSLDDFRV
jgi:hypothetical protein